MLPDETTLECQYHGETGKSSLTVAEFKDRMKEEDAGWLAAVLSMLESQGTVSLRFATYKVHR